MVRRRIFHNNDNVEYGNIHDLLLHDNSNIGMYKERNIRNFCFESMVDNFVIVIIYLYVVSL